MRRGWQRKLLLLGGLLAALVLGSAVLLRMTGFGQALVRDSLARVIRGEFGMSGADLDILGGTVEIRDLDLKDPDRPARDLLTVDRVLVDISRNPLSAGRLRKVTLSRIALHLRLGSGEAPDLSRVVDLAGRTGGGDPPRIEIRDSTCLLYLPGETSPGWTFQRIFLVLTPAAGSPGAYELSGRILAPMGALLELSGSLELDGEGPPRVRLEASCPELALQRAARCGLPEVDQLLAGLEPEGTAALRLWLEYPGPSGRLRGGLAARLADLALTAPEVPYRITGLNGTVEAWTDGDGTLLADLRSEATRASFSLAGRVERPGRPDADWDLRAEARAVAVDSVLEKALLGARDPHIGEVWRTFRPGAGRVDARIGLKSPASGGPPEVAVDLDLDSVAATYLGTAGAEGRRPGFTFPYPFEGISGGLLIRPGGNVTIPGLACRAGEGTVRVSGRLRVLPGRGSSSLRFEAREVPFDGRLREAVAAALPDGARIWDDYAPEGTFDARVLVERAEGEEAARVTTEIRPREASASYRLCPYRLDRLTGAVLIAPAGVSFDLQAGSGAPLVEVHGRFPFLEGGHREHMELTLAASALPVDRKLRDALEVLDPVLGELWDAFAPGGAVGLELAAAGLPGGDGPRFDIGVDLEGCAFAYKSFPVPVAEARGKVYIAAEPALIRADLLGLEGKAWGSPVKIYGSLSQERRSGAPAAMDVTVIGSGIRITPALGEILHGSGFLHREVFDLAAAEGRFDVVQRLERGGGAREIAASSELQLLGVESASRLLTDRATGVVGTVLASRAGMDILWLEGRIGEAAVTVPRGKVRLEPESATVELRATSPSFPVDERIARLMDAPVDRVYLDRRTRAAVRLAPLDLVFRIPRKAGFPSIEFEGSFEALGGETLLGLPVRGIEGPFSIQKGRLRQGELFVRGNLEGMRMTVSGLPLREITGAFEMTEAGLRIPEGGLTLASGRVTAREPGRELFSLGFSAPRPLGADLRFQGIDLEELCARSEGLSRAYKGSLSGELELLIPDQDPRNIHGALRLSIKEARIGQVPLLGELYRLMASRSQPTFNEGKLSVQVRDGRAEFKEIRLHSNFIDVAGNGSFSLAEGIDFQFKAGNLGTLLLNPLLTYRMQGTLRDYRVSVESPILPRGRSYRVGDAPVLPDFADLGERPLIPDPGRQ